MPAAAGESMILFCVPDGLGQVGFQVKRLGSGLRKENVEAEIGNEGLRWGWGSGPQMSRTTAATKVQSLKDGIHIAETNK